MCNVKVEMDRLLIHWAPTTFMTIITIYALFGDDLRLLTFNKVIPPNSLFANSLRRKTTSFT